MKRLIAVLSAGLLAGAPAWGEITFPPKPLRVNPSCRQLNDLRRACKELYPEAIGNEKLRLELMRGAIKVFQEAVKQGNDSLILSSVSGRGDRGYRTGSSLREILDEFTNEAPLFSGGRGQESYALAFYCTWAFLVDQEESFNLYGKDEEGLYAVFYDDILGGWVAFRPTWRDFKPLRSLAN